MGDCFEDVLQNPAPFVRCRNSLIKYGLQLYWHTTSELRFRFDWFCQHYKIIRLPNIFHHP
jgi:hypothetical protein